MVPSESHWTRSSSGMRRVRPPVTVRYPTEEPSSSFRSRPVMAAAMLGGTMMMRRFSVNSARKMTASATPPMIMPSSLIMIGLRCLGWKQAVAALLVQRGDECGTIDHIDDDHVVPLLGARGIRLERARHQLVLTTRACHQHLAAALVERQHQLPREPYQATVVRHLATAAPGNPPEQFHAEGARGETGPGGEQHGH